MSSSLSFETTREDSSASSQVPTAGPAPVEDRSNSRSGRLPCSGGASSDDIKGTGATRVEASASYNNNNNNNNNDNDIPEPPNETRQHHGFRMQVVQTNNAKKVAARRKRKRDANNNRKNSNKSRAGSQAAPSGGGGSSLNMSLSSSSSSSSDDDDEKEEDEQGAKRKTIIADRTSGDHHDELLTGSNSEKLLLSKEKTNGQLLPQAEVSPPINGILHKGRYGSRSPERESQIGRSAESSAETTKEGKSSTQQQHDHQHEQEHGQQQHLQHQSGQGQHQHHHHQQHQQQSDGWRVKLYRLNSDGSWDDCGTGSILCLYKKSAGHAPLTTTSAGQNAETSPPPPPPSQLSGDAWIYHELGEPTLCMHSEIKHPTAGVTPAPKILLRTRILLRDAYQRQGDNIITWCEPYLEEGNSAQGVDLALSFQEIAGCLDIWHQITEVQSKAAELFRKDENDRGGSSSASGGGASESNKNNTNRSHHPSSKLQHGSANGGSNTSSSAGEEQRRGSSVEDMAHAVAAAHHANLQRQQQEEIWVNVASEAAQHHLDHQNALATERDHEHPFEEGTMVAAYHESSSGPQSLASSMPQSPHLPNPPTLANLEEIADTIAAVQHMQQRESLAMYISQNECSYLKSLLSLFPSAESRGDYGSLATLAACIKTILLLNEPSIIELIVSDELIFEEVCSTLEYDPDLRDKANHRWFLRERAKFRTVALMEDEDLVVSIHRAFRVNYLRDTLLRPTMDESSLSTLSSLQTFTHADVVKGVTMSPAGTDDKGELLKDSYLAKVIRILGRELDAICDREWQEIEELPARGDIQSLLLAQAEDPATDTSTIVVTGKYPQSQNLSRVWKQYLAPQDSSLASRRIRRRGSLSFLRELFNMVRISLQQSDKDDFFAVLVSMEVDLDYGTEKSIAESRYTKSGTGNRMMDSEVERKSDAEQQSKRSPSRSVNLLSLLGTMLADPNTDVTEKGSVLEIISGIAMHDPGLVRRRCLDSYVTWRRERGRTEKHLDSIGPIRPHPNEKRQLLFHCPPNDLLGSLMFLLAMETDAGVLLQVSEIMRIILDTDMMADHGPMGGGFTDEPEGMPPGGGHNPLHEQHSHPPGSLTTSTDQNQFLSMFYDHYVQWLAAPFQYKIIHPVRRIPKKILEKQGESEIIQKMIERFEKGQCHEEPLLCLVSKNAIRSSFAVELLSFCARAHLYRMKCYLLRSRVLGNVLKVLNNKTNPSRNFSGGRCLALAGLRFLRSILSVKDEFYHRHIIQHNLFAPVFEAFRANPVGDNLVSSAIVEMCDFVYTENIKSLIEHIVTKHLSTTSETPIPSLEDVSSPYVSTLAILRRAYEHNLKTADKAAASNTKEGEPKEGDNLHSEYFNGGPATRTPVALNEKAREDQRKFREADQEESYFDDDDDDGPPPSTIVPPGVDEVAAQEADNELHRAPRMFTLTQAPMLNGTPRRPDEQDIPEIQHGTVRSHIEVDTATRTTQGVEITSETNRELI